MCEKVKKALNEQMMMEFFSANLYLAMSAWFDSRSLKGMAHWMRVQAQEEQEHAMRFFDFIQERGGRADIESIDAPRQEWESPLDAFEDAHQHECKITGLINELTNLTLENKDFATHNFLQWFVTEQVEEEATVLEIVDKLKLVGDNGAALFMLEAELANRAGTSGPESN